MLLSLSIAEVFKCQIRAGLWFVWAEKGETKLEAKPQTRTMGARSK